MDNQQPQRTRWRRVASGVAAFLIFILALWLMKEGAGGLEPLLQGHLNVTNAADSMGFGWLTSCILLSGSPVAAAAMALLSAEILSPLQAFTMVAGSRMGASLVVLLIGFVYALREHDRWTALTAGVLSLLLVGSIQSVALPLGVLVLNRGWLDHLQLRGLEGLAGVLNQGLSPAIGPVRAFLPDWALFVAGVALVTLSFRLFDHALPQVRLSRTGFGQVARLIYRPEVMFLLGLGVTLLTMSVSISVGILVPLSARGYTRRENIIPYILGANISTLIDTLAAAVLVGSGAGVSVVLAHVASATVISLPIVLLAYRPYERAISGALGWITRQPANFAIFLTVVFLIPVVLILF